MAQRAKFGEDERRNGFAEWHNYAKYDICEMT